MEPFQVDVKSAEGYSSHDNIQMKVLGITPDDYIEQRVPDALNKYPYPYTSSLDFTKYSNEVSFFFYYIFFELNFNNCLIY